MDDRDRNNNLGSVLPSKESRNNLLEEKRKQRILIEKKNELIIKKFLTGFFYSFFILFILWISILFSFSQNIWFMERFFGLISYFLFFVTLCIGILRKFGVKFIWIIKYHKPTAIWAFMFLLAHIISVIFDNFKWGYQLSLLTYLGLDFSSKWLWPTSIGAIAFWIFLVVVITSVGKNMSKLGFKLWKKIHYFSYIAFILMSVHAFFIGTDFKVGTYSFIVYWSAILMNIIVGMIFSIRIFSIIKNKK